MLPLSTIIETPTPTWYTLSITAEMRASDILVLVKYDGDAQAELEITVKVPGDGEISSYYEV